MRALLLLLPACTSLASPADAPEDTDAVAFEPFTVDDRSTDPLTERLCAEAANPEAAPDTTFLDCRLGGGSYADPEATVPERLQVVVWNLERGLRLEAQLAAWGNGTLPLPDVLLASELDRGCARTGGLDVPREVARALGLAWAFQVEFLELPRGDGIDPLCEHGNAVFSRFPLGNVRGAFHRSNVSWYLPPEARTGNTEPRLGGRSWVSADVDLGDEALRVVSLHFESRIAAFTTQVDQATELAELAAASPLPVLVAGDTNAPTYTGDVFDGDAALGRADDAMIAALLDAGLVDAHAGLAPELRPTRSGLVIDLLLGKDVTFSDAQVCPEATCAGLSDHQPIWADVDLGGAR